MLVKRSLVDSAPYLQLLKKDVSLFLMAHGLLSSPPERKQEPELHSGGFQSRALGVSG